MKSIESLGEAKQSLSQVSVKAEHGYKLQPNSIMRVEDLDEKKQTVVQRQLIVTIKKKGASKKSNTADEFSSLAIEDDVNEERIITAGI